MYEVWINTRIDGKVEDYIMSCHDDYEEARDKVHRMNTKVDAYPDIVSWLESNDSNEPSSDYRPKSIRPKTKLTPSIARRIRERVSAGEMKTVLAREYDVCPSSITRVVKGESFGDV